MRYSSALATGPRLAKIGGKLVATTSLYIRVCTLGLVNRTVIVDTARRCVTIKRRLCWFFRRRLRIPFDSIRAVTYGYQDWAANSWSWTHRSADSYKVGLRLLSRKEVHLFFFCGEGEFSNQGPLPDWFYWVDYQLDIAGTQGQESRCYAELLSKIIGVPLEPPSM